MEENGMKKMVAMVLALGLVFSIAGCGSSAGEEKEKPVSETSEESTEEAVSEDKGSGHKIGFACDDLSTDFGSALNTTLEAKCAELGWELLTTDSGMDSSTQTSQVDNLITNGCEAIFIKPYDQSACGAISQACEDAGVPLICLVGKVSSSYTAFVGADMYASGAAMAQYAVDAYTGSLKKAVIVLGPLAIENMTLRADGVRDVLNENGFEIVGEILGENKTDIALTVMENFISTGEEFDMVIAMTDSSAIGAITALKGNDMKSDVYVFGNGGQEEGQESIRAGELDGTIYLPSSLYAEVGMEVVQKILNGEDYEKDNLVDFVLMDASNVDEF